MNFWEEAKPRKDFKLIANFQYATHLQKCNVCFVTSGRLQQTVELELAFLYAFVRILKFNG